MSRFRLFSRFTASMVTLQKSLLAFEYHLGSKRAFIDNDRYGLVIGTAVALWV